MKKKVSIKPKKLSIAIKAVPIYEKDYIGWIEYQKNLLKHRNFESLDMENLLEEIDSLGNSEKNAVESYLANLLLHLLKIKYQPAMHTKSWDNSVKNSKYHVQRKLQKNPSIKNSLPEILKDAYFTARLNAASETGLDEKTFPKQCPWKIEELI